jgi:hypothetical protein
VPLQTGADSLGSLIWSCAGLVPLAAGLGSCVGCAGASGVPSASLGLFGVLGTFVASRHRRRCVAPLPDPPPGSVISRCVYCQAANVMGVDITADQSSATAGESELESALAMREREVIVRVIAVAVAVSVVYLTSRIS